MKIWSVGKWMRQQAAAVKWIYQEKRVFRPVFGGDCGQGQI